MTVEERERASAHIVNKFFENFDLSSVKVLHCFIPIERFGEVDTRPIFQRVWSDHPDIVTVAPRVNHKTGDIESLLYGPDTELRHNRWQIGEPVHDDRVEPDQIDLVLIPLLCYDLTGHRVGYGKGYYDRFLSRCRPDCQKIGLSMFAPIEKITDTNEADVRLDSCIVPTGIVTFSS
jgi:5-formyltetrahydrofolate cyclo-ligase